MQDIFWHINSVKFEHQVFSKSIQNLCVKTKCRILSQIKPSPIHVCVRDGDEFDCVSFTIKSKYRVPYFLSCFVDWNGILGFECMHITHRSRQDARLSHVCRDELSHIISNGIRIKPSRKKSPQKIPLNDVECEPVPIESSILSRAKQAINRSNVATEKRS